MPAPKKRGRPKGSGKPKKGRLAKIGHNSNGLEDETLLLIYHQQMNAIEGEERALRSKRSKALKQAKLDGIDTRLANKARKELGLVGDEVVLETNILNSYRRAFDLPHTDDMRSEASIIDDAERAKLRRREGKRAAYRGAPVDANPHDLTLPAGQDWQRGYDEASHKMHGASTARVIAQEFAGTE